MIESLLGPSQSQLNAALRSQAEGIATLSLILLQKGLCTPEEFEAARLQAISLLDQQVAASAAAAAAMRVEKGGAYVSVER